MFRGRLAQLASDIEFETQSLFSGETERSQEEIAGAALGVPVRPGATFEQAASVRRGGDGTLASIGDRFRDVELAEDADSPQLLDVRLSDARLLRAAADVFRSWPEETKAADGARVLLQNPEGGTLARRLSHMARNSATQAVAAEKAAWIPNVPATVERAQVRLGDQETGNKIYVRRYAGGQQHFVVVRPDGTVESQQPWNGRVITQFPGGSSKQGRLRIEWERAESRHGVSGTDRAGRIDSSGQNLNQAHPATGLPFNSDASTVPPGSGDVNRGGGRLASIRKKLDSLMAEYQADLRKLVDADPDVQRAESLARTWLKSWANFGDVDPEDVLTRSGARVLHTQNLPVFIASADGFGTAWEYEYERADGGRGWAYAFFSHGRIDDPEVWLGTAWRRLSNEDLKAAYKAAGQAQYARARNLESKHKELAASYGTEFLRALHHFRTGDLAPEELRNLEAAKSAFLERGDSWAASMRWSDEAVAKNRREQSDWFDANAKLLEYIANRLTGDREGDGTLASIFRRQPGVTPGQKGWGDGNLSARAEDAYERGLRTAKDIAKAYGVPVRVVEDSLSRDEWHHVLRPGRKTPDAVDFFEFDPENNPDDADMLAKMRAAAGKTRTEGAKRGALARRARQMGFEVREGRIYTSDGRWVGKVDEEYKRISVRPDARWDDVAGFEGDAVLWWSGEPLSRPALERDNADWAEHLRRQEEKQTGAEGGTRASIRKGLFPGEKNRLDMGMARFMRDELGREAIEFSRTPSVMRAMGFADRPVLVPRTVLGKMLGYVEDANPKAKSIHDLPKEIVDRIPWLMADPIAVFDSATQGGRLVFMLDARHKGETVMVAVQPDAPTGLSSKDQGHVVTSAYQRPDHNFIEWARSGRLRYVNKEKAAQWSRASGLQLPTAASPRRGSTSRVLGVEDVVKWEAENVPKDAPGPQLGPGPGRGQMASIRWRDAPGPIWYSKLKETVAAKMQGPMDADALRNMLTAAGVKPEEMEWSRMGDLRGRVSKEQVEQHLAAHALEVREVTGSEADDTLPPSSMRDVITDQQILGGENYRELLLTIPPKNDYTVLLKSGGTVGQWSTQAEADQWLSTSARSDLDGAVVEPVLADNTKNFRGDHFNELNVLAHVRFNERTDADGKRVLFIEEIQSDWHQRGRKKGYKSEFSGPLKAIQRDGYFVVQTDGGRFISNIANPPIATPELAVAEAQRRMAQEPNRTGGIGVPDAPFKKTWHELALKRMVRWAAENGFERVAWTTGEQQAERYDLSKQIEELAYWRDGDLVGLSAMTQDGTAVLDQQYFAPEKLPDVVGEDAANRILNGEGVDTPTVYSKEPGVKYLRGDDLKVGGEGMKGFYDRMLPTAVNKLFKRHGVRAGKTTLPEAGEVHSFDIPESLAGEAVTRGMQLASIRKREGDANIRRGREAMERVISGRVDVDDAMEREGLGTVSFVWGQPGNARKGFAGGYGVAHIMAKRTAEGEDGEAVARAMVETIAKGNASEPYGPPEGLRVDVTHGSHRAVLSLYRHREKRTWLLTGFKESGPVEPGVSTNPPDYASGSFGSRSRMGAGPSELTVPRDGDDVNSGGTRASIWKRGNVPEVRDSAGRLLAPNGKPSNLNEGQWHQVRTPEFKQWFGDWEAAAKRMQIVDVNPSALGGALTREGVEEWAQRYAGKNYSNRDTGWSIRVSGRAISKTLSGERSNVRVHRAVVLELPALLESAIKTTDTPDRNNDPNIEGVHRLLGAARVDGKTYAVRLSVKTIRNDGRRFYDHTVTEIEISAGNLTADTREGQSASSTTAETSTVSVADLLPGLKPEHRPSRIVDGNGEPMVLYHGTGSVFTSFDMSRAGESTGGYLPIRGMFFSRNPDYKNHLPGDGENGMVMPVYLNLRNPARVDTYDELDTVLGEDTDGYPDRGLALLTERGFDGVIFGRGEEIIATSPEQVKSATGNSGAFDRGNPDIRASIRKGLTRREELGRQVSMDAYGAGKLSSGSPVLWSRTPSWMRMFGHADMPLVMSQREMMKVGKGKHWLDRLPAAVADPDEVFRHGSRYAVVTGLEVKGERVAVIIKPDAFDEKRKQSHVVVSAYPVGDKQVASWREHRDYEALYKKTEALTTTGALQPRKAVARGLRSVKRIAHGADLDKWESENLTAEERDAIPTRARLQFNRDTGQVEDQPGGGLRASIRRRGSVPEVRDSAGRLLAPNGKPSNLNEGQWHQVRTPEFKRWFGDWEAAGLKDHLREVRGSDQAREAAKTFLNRPLVNRDSGIAATMSGQSLGKLLSESAVSRSMSPRAHMMAVGNLDRLFELALHRESRPAREGGAVVREVHHFEVPMPFGGDFVRVRIMAKEFEQEDQGTRIYLVSAVEIAKPASIGGSLPRLSASQISVPPAGFESRLQELARAVKGDAVSKVVDANGEPMVVYHGTKERFTTFEMAKAGENTGGYLPVRGMFFSHNPDYKYHLPDGDEDDMQIPVYLHLHNPARADSYDDLEAVLGEDTDGYPDRGLALLTERGFDGVVFGTGEEIIATSPEQVKSATGNSGAFDRENPDIRASIRRGLTRREELGRQVSMDAYEAGKLSSGSPVLWSRAPSWMRMFGHEDAPLVMSQREMVKVGKGKHWLDRDTLDRLPAAVADPDEVFRHGDRYVAVTGLRMKNGDRVAVFIEPDATVGNRRNHVVVSAYPVSDGKIDVWEQSRNYNRIYENAEAPTATGAPRVRKVAARGPRRETIAHAADLDKWEAENLTAEERDAVPTRARLQFNRDTGQVEDQPGGGLRASIRRRGTEADGGGTGPLDYPASGKPFDASTDDISAPALLQMPELLRFGNRLMGGTYPAIRRRLRGMRGMALGWFSPRPGSPQIALRADIFIGPQIGAQTGRKPWTEEQEDAFREALLQHYDSQPDDLIIRHETERRVRRYGVHSSSAAVKRSMRSAGSSMPMETRMR